MQPLPILYVQNATAVDALIQHYKREVDGQIQMFRFGRPSAPGTGSIVPAGDAAGQIDWSNVITRFVASAIDLFANFGGDADQKKAAVIAAATQFYRDVVGPLVAEGVGHPFIFNTFITPAIEKLLPRLIGGVYDAITGIFDRKAGTAQGMPPALPPLPSLPAGFVPY